MFKEKNTETGEIALKRLIFTQGIVILIKS